MFVLYNILQSDNIMPSHQQEWINELSDSRKAQMECLQNQQDKLQSLIGLQLLKTGMRLCGELHFSLDSLRFSPRGKPFADSRLQFSISHSHLLTACAVSTQGLVGLDLEPRTLTNRPPLEQYFSTQEIQLIHDNPEALSGLWTQKESVVKAHGERGLEDIPHVILNEHAASLHGKQWYIHALSIHEDYSVHLACENRVEEVTFCQIEMP